jgi:hypothetical protein
MFDRLEVAEVVAKEQLQHAQVNAGEEPSSKLKGGLAKLGLEALDKAPLKQVIIALK